MEIFQYIVGLGLFTFFQTMHNAWAKKRMIYLLTLKIFGKFNHLFLKESLKLMYGNLLLVNCNQVNFVSSLQHLATYVKYTKE